MSCLLPNAENVLLTDWVPEVIIDREEQKREIEGMISTILSSNLPIPITFVYGASGSGKTFLIRKMFKDHEEALRKVPNFKYVYINCGALASFHALWVSIANSLTEYLPIKISNEEIKTIPVRGWETWEYIRVVKEIVKQKKLIFLLIIDEIDKLNIEDIKLLIHQIYERDGDGGISAILITNKMGLLNSLDASSLTRIGKKIHFKSYSISDLVQILKVHAEVALKPNTWDEKTLILAVREMYDESNSARQAKVLLYNLAKLSNEKLDVTKIHQAWEETKKDLLKEEIANRPLHHKLALLSVIRFVKRNEKMANLNKPGLFKYAKFLPTKANIYKEYEIICKEYGESPKAYRTFFVIIDDLENYGLVKTTIASLGRARGVVTLVYPSDFGKMYEEVVEEAI